MKINETTLFEGFLTLKNNTYQENEETIDRIVVEKKQVVAALLFNTTTQKYILVEQHRHAFGADVLEIPAGHIDDGETALDAIVREIQEETGYKIDPDETRILPTIATSPGFTNETVSLFYMETNNNSRIATKLGTEGENIKLVEMDFLEFSYSIKKGKIIDAKTIVAFACIENI